MLGPQGVSTVNAPRLLPPPAPMQTQTKDYWKLFKPSACSISLKGTGQEEIFGEIVGNLLKARSLEEDQGKDAIKALLERETLASTGVGQNVAIPHVKVKGLSEAVVSLSLHREGVAWNSLDGEDVNIFFAVLRPDRPGATFDPERHLEMMRWISSLGRVADFRRFALGVTNRTELVDLLKEMSAV